MCRDYYDDPKNGLPDGEMLLFMGFPSAKDPDWNKKYSNKSLKKNTNVLVLYTV